VRIDERGEPPEGQQTERTRRREAAMKAYRRKRLGVLLVMAVVLSVQSAAPSAAAGVPDQVLAWNQHAYNELIVGQGPSSIQNVAMVHGAMYDAVNAIDGGYRPYLVAPPAEPTYSKDAAAATAAYQVLLYLLPARASQLAQYYDESLALIPDGPDEQGGIGVGMAAATAMIDRRRDDGRPGTPSFTTASFTVGSRAGDWRPFADGLAGNNFKWIGDVDPWLVPDPSTFATDGPLQLGSAAYAAEFDQVKSLGAANSTTRTTDQTEQALFWFDNAFAMWTRIFRQLSASQELSVAENARFFAMAYLTAADAQIACYQDKERWGFWRPQTAIREAATDGNPATVADPNWTALLPNPPYPDHPSGHNCVSSSFVETLKDFYGTNRMSFSATHSNPALGINITRSFTHFSQAIAEIRLARMYGGIHFVTADAQGATLGRKVAQWRDEHYFQPVR
jgi:PAP2 superfamily